MAQAVDLLMVPFFDKTAVADADRWIVHDRCLDEIVQIFQLIDVRPNFLKQRRLQAFEQIFDVWKHGQR